MDAPFGGVNVIFFGDYLQYYPVLDKPLYHSHALAQQYNERRIEMQCAQTVISQINCVVELNQQMWTEAARYLELVTRLRDGKSTVEDYQLLCILVIGAPNLKISLQQEPWNEDLLAEAVSKAVKVVKRPTKILVNHEALPLSRVKRLDDLLIVRSFNFSSLRVKPTAAQMEELNR
ncbi:unnamed protein product [Rotaria magnacalcarata]|uniref:DNA helicase n=1 Tax=Rotaria magnacalcarata TaxID=392030 RepID=A0A8S2JUT2_9BILA|nr:unnamed protein product [Rotaria magnacalcarata]CAF3907288.1 unnamed protein product [Rotaria magnacalcarata]CAF3915922.1 unnamed protein product [Rotaria magnacalcarata]